MKEGTRKKICLVLCGASALAAVVLFGFSIKNYAQQIPIAVGPYKLAAFILLGLLFAAALGFYFRPLTRRTVGGSLLIAFGVCWFTAAMLLRYKSAGLSVLALMDQWMPVPLMAAGAGILLWAGSLISARKKGVRISEKGQLLLVLLLMFISLQPVLSGAFSWDDAFFSVEAQAMRITGESIFARVWREIVEYVRIGRINPFATFHFLFFYFVPDVRVYKFILLLLTLLNGYLFYRFLSLWGQERRTGLAALLIVPLCFQLRLYHDPLNSYYGLMQVMFCELMGSLILFVRWLRGKGKKFLLFSLLLFAMGLMSYEMFFPLTALFLIPALTHEKKLLPAIRRVLPHVVLAVMLFGLSMLLRTNITEETAYNGTTFGLDAGVILRTFGSQVGAALPLCYRTAGYDAAIFGKLIQWKTIFNTSVSRFFAGIQWQDLLGCCILIVLVCGISEEKPKFSGLKAAFALLLWFLPGLVISLSWKYQQELRPGLAYIPVYFSYFGAAMLLYEVIALLGKRVPQRTLQLIVSGIGCAVLLVTMQDNRGISARLNEIFLYPRETAEAALQAGILGETERQVISSAPYSLWEHGWQMEPYQSAFYSLNARRPVQAVGVHDFIARRAGKDSSWITPRNSGLMSYSGDEFGGFARYGYLRGTAVDEEADSLENPMVTDVNFFVSGKNENGILIYRTKEDETKRLPVKDAWLICRTEKGSLYKLQENEPILFDSIGILNY